MFTPLLLRRHRSTVVIDAREGGVKRVIVLLRNGIELVVVAPGTAHGEPQKRFARGADHLVDGVRPNLRRLDRILIAHRIVGPRNQKRHADFHRRITWPDRVPRQMFKHPTVEGFIVVQGLDDVVAIGPGIVDKMVYFKSGALSKAYHVQPMSGPMLTIVLRIQRPSINRS